MPVLQFRCSDCSAVFEQLLAGKQSSREFSCLSCSSFNVARLGSSFFYPNKTFCPHDKTLDEDHLQTVFNGLMGDRSLSCAGCGVDGPEGSCGSATKSCGNCTCGKGGCGNKM